MSLLKMIFFLFFSFYRAIESLRLLYQVDSDAVWWCFAQNSNLLSNLPPPPHSSLKSISIDQPNPIIPINVAIMVLGK